MKGIKFYHYCLDFLILLTIFLIGLLPQYCILLFCHFSYSEEIKYIILYYNSHWHIILIMTHKTTITPNFQVHIPVGIRKKSGMTHHGKALIRVEKGRIIIEPQLGGILALGGSFKVKKPIKAEQIRKYINLSTWTPRCLSIQVYLSVSYPRTMLKNIRTV